MAGWRGKALGVGTLTAALLAGAVLAGQLLLDQQTLIATARDRVQAATGRQLQIATLSVRWLPLPALRATGVALSSPDWAQHRDMIEADQVDMQLSWRALLSGRLAPGAILIRQAGIHLETSADGKRSWHIASDGKASGAHWQYLRELRAETIDLVYRNPAGEHLWKIQSMAASSAPSWRNAQLQADLLRGSERMHLEADMADLSQAGQAGASSQGRIVLRLPNASATLSGILPLSQKGSAAMAADLAVQADSAAQAIGFFSAANPVEAPPAALSLQARLRGADQALTFDITELKLGSTEASGSLTLRHDSGKPLLEGHLAIPSLDWTTLRREAGKPPLAPLAKGEIFRRDPLPWKSMAALAGVDSRLTLSIDKLRLHSGIRVGQLQASLRGGGGRISIAPFSMALLGGTASGKLNLDGARHAADLTLDASGITLERWFSERGRKLPVTGGPMRIHASLQARGDTQRDIAASADGLITVRGGATVIRSEKAGNAESLLTDLFPLFSERDASQLRLQCFAGRLPLRRGQANGALVGARSDASQLLTRGSIDLRQQDVDLRGRVRARNGISLGVALVSGDVVIAGPLAKPKMALDPSSPGALARLGAAVLTGGLSVVATAAWDAANPAANPCEAALEERRAAAR
ncbi:AsmA family protein|uniref:AsmA family protein n=1 Tax=Noviherbaspirillum sp. L7-7A TaxID=2850560 RepID=UPI001C2CA588|nr:AsmA family protein [Noviherbaspirillum sp. L7-7A]MBV0878228.1 AsmA family protein [Noviherbaspirillum sp. L7-7A]